MIKPKNESETFKSLANGSFSNILNLMLIEISNHRKKKLMPERAAPVVIVIRRDFFYVTTLSILIQNKKKLKTFCFYSHRHTWHIKCYYSITIPSNPLELCFLNTNGSIHSHQLPIAWLRAAPSDAFCFCYSIIFSCTALLFFFGMKNRLALGMCKACGRLWFRFRLKMIHFFQCFCFEQLLKCSHDSSNMICLNYWKCH